VRNRSSIQPLSYPGIRSCEKPRKDRVRAQQQVEQRCLQQRSSSSSSSSSAHICSFFFRICSYCALRAWNCFTRLM
jgi:hypothetical protein